YLTSRSRNSRHANHAVCGRSNIRSSSGTWYRIGNFDRLVFRLRGRGGSCLSTSCGWGSLSTSSRRSCLSTSCAPCGLHLLGRLESRICNSLGAQVPSSVRPMMGRSRNGSLPMSDLQISGIQGALLILCESLECVMYLSASWERHLPFECGVNILKDRSCQVDVGTGCTI